MSILRAYLKLVTRPNGPLRHDVSQVAVAERLDELLSDLSAHKAYLAKYVESSRKYEEEMEVQKTRIFDMKLKQRRYDGTYGGMAHVLQSNNEKEKDIRDMKAQAHTEAQNVMGPPPKKPPAPKSVYLYGNVGVGKTFLMDLFYEKARNALSFERDTSDETMGRSIATCRMHFNSAMVELHQHMHKIEQDYLLREKFTLKNPGKLAVLAARRRRPSLGHSFTASNNITFSTTLEKASKELFKLKTDKDAHLGMVCFDELQVPDAFTAIAIMSMFGVLFKEEAVVLSTSNCSPYELNDNAWFKEYYANFNDTLLEKCDVIELGNGIDYRTISLVKDKSDALKTSELKRFFSPQGTRSTSLLSAYIKKNRNLYDDSAGSPDDVEVKTIDVLFGRVLEIPAIGEHIARFDFLDFFSKPIGPADCLAIARSFKLVCIENIPVLNRNKKDQARRFITLVDELYNEGCLLACTAATPPDKLFKSEELGESLLDLEALQFEAEALTNATSRVTPELTGGVAAEATSQRIGTDEGAKALGKKMLGEEEQFAFKRAVSRIFEMQSDTYLQRRHKFRIERNGEKERKSASSSNEETKTMEEPLGQSIRNFVQ